MPIYDRKCPDGHLMLECYEKVTHPDIPCKECGKETKRVILTAKSRTVISDEIPGGIEIRHGLCNEDGSPRRYYSKSEIAKEAAKRGLEPMVRHVTPDGSDKSPHTVRWTAVDLTDYNDPAVIKRRREEMAAFLGLTMEQYDAL